MTVSSTKDRDYYTASASQTLFVYDFMIFDDTDLKVYVDSVLKTYATDYSVTNAGNPSGGNVVFVVPMVGGEQVAIIRKIPLTQLADYVENDPFPSETHEFALDKLTLLAQQVENRSLRSVRIPESDTTGTLTELPSNTDRALKYLFCDSDGDIGVTAVAPVGDAVVSPFWETVLDDASAGSSIETIRGGLSAETSIAIEDELLFRDTSATAGKRVTFENALKSINLLTEDTAPDNTADYVLTYSSSASGVKKVKAGFLIRHEPVRQTVVSGAVDASGYANFLSAGTGLAVSMTAASTPVIMTFANGENVFGPVNYRTIFSSNQTNYWAGLPANSQSYLIVDRDTVTGSVTAYKTLIPIQYGASFDKTRQALLPFSGTDASSVITDTYGNIWAALGNAQVDTGITIDSQQTLLTDGTDDGVTSADITTLPTDGWTFEGKTNFAALPISTAKVVLAKCANAGGFGLEVSLYNNAGTYQLEITASSDGTTNNIASAVRVNLPSTPSTGTPYHWAATWDKVAGKLYTYWTGIKVNDTTMTTNICAVTSVTICSTSAGANSVNGNTAGFRLSPCVRYPAGTTFSPATLPFSADAEWFDLSTFTWKFGAPGAFATKQRVAVGEVTTNASAPTSTVTYALRGEYVSLGDAIPAVNTSVSKNHYIGMKPRQFSGVVICKTANGGYSPGDEVPWTAISETGTFQGSYQALVVTRNQVGFATSAYDLSLLPKAGGAALGLGNAVNWVYVLRAKRGW